MALCYSSPADADTAWAVRLSKRAQAELIRGRYTASLVLLRGAWEMTHDVRLLARLAHINAINGRFSDAIETYTELLKAKPPKRIADNARKEIARLRAAPLPFNDKVPIRARVRSEAVKAFKVGSRFARRARRTRKRKRKSALRKSAIRYLRAALALDSTLPGTYRLLGALYGQLKNKEQEKRFLVHYLRVRPDGRNAKSVRRRLRKSGLLGTVIFSSSFPCEIWVNGRRLNMKSPNKLGLAPGRHVISFVHRQYHVIRNLSVIVKPGKTSRVVFAFGVLKVRLTPWARVRSRGRDLGLWSAIGLPIGSYDLDLTAYNDTKKKSVTIKIRSGEVSKITRW